MTRIADLISVHEAARAVDLAGTAELVQALDRDGPDLSFGNASRLDELLADYVSSEAEAVDPLRVLLNAVAANGERGGAFMVRGNAGTGKSHLLSVLALLLQHPAAWTVLLRSHPTYGDLHPRLAGKRHLVVPIPLSEHRGHEEHLEDIVFDRTEQALRSPPCNLAVPLSEQSYALDLIARHIAPRYAKELDAYVRQHEHGYPSWERLRQVAPARAVEAARRFAAESRYPLDFRQSRVERLSRLLEIMREHGVPSVVWLVDDLQVFLSGASPKAVRGDCSFLDFMGQRAKIAPVHVIATLDEGLEQLAAVEPYVLNAIRAGYRTDLVLTAEHMRAVARRRVVSRVDPDRTQEALAQVRQAYVEAFGSPSFTEAALAESYPLHPAALQCLESIVSRFLGAGDTLVAFMQELLDQTTLAGVLQRDFRQLVGVNDVFDYLRPRIASHPEVAAYIYDALDYYHKNGDAILPEAPGLCERLAQALIVFRLANVAAQVPLLAETLGLDAEGHCVADAGRVSRALEAMRLTGSFVDIRRGGPDMTPVYVVDVISNISEGLRRRLAAAKAAFGPDDSRPWRRAVSACDDPAFPLAQLAESRTLEVLWENSSRGVTAELVDLTTITPAEAAETAADLGDPATVEDAHLYLARLSGQAAQLRAWQEIREGLPPGRWSAAVLAWVPRELSPQELDALKEFAAVSEFLEDEASLSADPSLQDRLNELYGPLLGRARQIVRDAYYRGQVLSAFGPAVTAEELAALSGSWGPTLEAATARAFARVFPGFPALSPRRPLTSREQIDALVDQVIRPGVTTLSETDPLRDLAQGFLVPLGIARLRGEECVVDVTGSKLAAEVMDRVRLRDQTPQSQLGRPVSCSDLAQHLLKSPLGLPPELFELVIAALIRTGYLAPVKNRQAVRFEDVPTPLNGSFQHVARPPLLTPGEWQVLTRVCRIVLDLPLMNPDLGLQAAVWERLLQARTDHLDQAHNLRRRLEEHIEDLGQRPGQWQEAFADIEALERFFQCVRPELAPSLGLQEFIRDINPLVGDAQGTPRLNGLFRRANALSAYLQDTAPDVLALQRYLLSPLLNVEPAGDLDVRRQGVLEVMAGGERIVTDELNLRRQVQIFLASYKRRYLSWHGRVYRSPLFDQYRSVHQSPEMRALSQLGKLHLKVDVTYDDVAGRVETQVGRRCLQPDLQDLLDASPVCPDCKIRLNEEPDLLPVEALVEEASAALRGYLQVLSRTGVRQRLADYARLMPRRGDQPARIEAIAQITEEATPREVLGLFTDDVIPHVNRVLSGKRLAPRNFSELRETLAGRTLTKDEAQKLFSTWLEGREGDSEDDSVLQIEA